MPQVSDGLRPFSDSLIRNFLSIELVNDPVPAPRQPGGSGFVLLPCRQPSPSSIFATAAVSRVEKAAHNYRLLIVDQWWKNWLHVAGLNFEATSIIAHQTAANSSALFGYCSHNSRHFNRHLITLPHRVGSANVTASVCLLASSSVDDNWRNWQYFGTVDWRLLLNNTALP